MSNDPDQPVAARASRPIGRIWREGHISIEPKADALDGGDLRRLLAGAFGGGAQVTAQFGNTGIERIFAGGVIIGLAPDRQKLPSRVQTVPGLCARCSSRPYSSGLSCTGTSIALTVRASSSITVRRRQNVRLHHQRLFGIGEVAAPHRWSLARSVAGAELACPADPLRR